MTKNTADLQERLYQEFVGRIKQTDENVPYRSGGWYYYSRTVEGKQYPIVIFLFCFHLLISVTVLQKEAIRK